MHGSMEDVSHFRVNVLHRDQEEMARIFADRRHQALRFSEGWTVDCERPPRLVDAQASFLCRRIDQHHPGNVVRMLAGIAAHDVAAQRMTHQQQRCVQAGGADQRMQVGDVGGKIARQRALVAEAVAGAVIGTHARMRFQQRLHAEPALRIGMRPGLQQYGHRPAAAAAQVEAAPVIDGDALAGPGVAVRRGRWRRRSRRRGGCNEQSAAGQAKKSRVSMFHVLIRFEIRHGTGATKGSSRVEIGRPGTT